MACPPRRPIAVSKDTRVRVDGFVRDLSEDIVLDKMKKHSVEVVVDRFVVRRGAEAD